MGLQLEVNTDASGASTYSMQFRFATESPEGIELTLASDTVTLAPVGDAADISLILASKGSGSVEIDGTAISAAGLALIDDATAADQRTTLGLGTLATQSGTFSGTSSGTNTGDQTITLTGDVTGSGTGSFAASIAAGAVSYAKMQDVSATDKVLGRSTAGSGDVEEIACTAAARSLLDDATVSDMRTTLGLVIGTNVQAYDAELAALAGLTSAANKLARFTGSGTADLLDVSATPAASTVPVASSLGQLAREWVRPFFFDRRLVYVQHDVGATTVSRFGLAADPTSTGTRSSADTVSGCYELCTSGTTIGNTAGRITAANVIFRDWSPRATWKVLSAASIANMRWWIGFTSADLSGVSGDPTTQHVAAFRYDTAVDGTAFWRCVTCDGASNVTTTTTTVAIASSTAYNLRIEFDDAAGSVKFYVNETLAATHTTNRPASATGMLAQWCVTTLASAAKRISWSWFGVEVA